MIIKESRKRVYKTLWITLIVMLICMLFLYWLIKPYITRVADKVDDLTKPTAEKVADSINKGVSLHFIIEDIPNGHRVIVYKKKTPYCITNTDNSGNNN